MKLFQLALALLLIAWRVEAATGPVFSTNTGGLTVRNLAALISLNPVTTTNVVAVLNGTSLGDGFFGFFYPTNTASSTNRGTRIADNTAGWSWQRLGAEQGPVDDRWFGGSPSVDSRAALQAALNTGRDLRLTGVNLIDGTGVLLTVKTNGQRIFGTGNQAVLQYIGSNTNVTMVGNDTAAVIWRPVFQDFMVLTSSNSLGNIAIDLKDTPDAIVQNVTVGVIDESANPTDGFRIGIRGLTSDAALGSYRLTIRNNRITTYNAGTNLTFGIHFSGPIVAHGPNASTISENIIRATGGIGVYMTNTWNTTTEKNTFEGRTVICYKNDGMVGGATEAKVLHNHFEVSTNPSSVGVAFGVNSHANTLKDNTFENLVTDLVETSTTASVNDTIIGTFKQRGSLQLSLTDMGSPIGTIRLPGLDIFAPSAQTNYYFGYGYTAEDIPPFTMAMAEKTSYNSILLGRNLDGVIGSDAFRTLSTTTNFGYDGILLGYEFIRIGGRNLVSTTNGATVVPVFQLHIDKLNNRVGIETATPRSLFDIGAADQFDNEMTFGFGNSTLIPLRMTHTRTASYADALIGKNLRGDLTGASDNYKTIATTAGSGYSGIEFRHEGQVNIYSASGATTADQVITPQAAIAVKNGLTGMGTDNPATKLDVKGAISYDSTVPSEFNFGDVANGGTVVLSGSTNGNYAKINGATWNLTLPSHPFSGAAVFWLRLTNVNANVLTFSEAVQDSRQFSTLTATNAAGSNGEYAFIWSTGDGKYLFYQGNVAPTTGGSANPTAAVNGTAVNGSAATFLRSDGAPALADPFTPADGTQNITGAFNVSGNTTSASFTSSDDGSVGTPAFRFLNATDAGAYKTTVLGGTAIGLSGRGGGVASFGNTGSGVPFIAMGGGGPGLTVASGGLRIRNGADNADENLIALTLTATSTTDSTSKDTGSAIFEGGVGIEKDAYVGGKVVSTGGFSSLLSKRIGTQYDATTTTLGTVTDLSVTVTAGVKYHFRARFDVTLDTTGGGKYAISGTATATAINYRVTHQGASLALLTSTRQTSMGSAVNSTAALTDDDVEIEGTLICNTGGTLVVQGAQQAASGTTSFLTGGSFIVTPIP